ncbi:Protein of unknown function [Ruegeria marina]|uniref:YhdP central domain-containing protein n=2 Tax=Ruegeria marina TaxID=639004 RepID=A0A1G6XJR0_9RHOB|nr:Protein of unknown function [Ruegeria marina]
MRGAILLVFLAAFSALMVVGHRLQAPPWLQARVESRLNTVLGDKRVSFGDVSLVINKGWRPRLRLRDVELSDAEGRVIARLSDAEASLAMRPLLRGQIQPKRISLSGAHANLRRDAEGAFTLSLGDGRAAVEQAPTLVRMLETFDGVFLNPALQALTSIEVTSLGLEYEDMRQGRAWTLDGGQVLLTRNSDAIRMATEFSVLSGRDYASRFEANYSSTLGQPTASFGISVTDVAAIDIAAQSPALAWFQVLDAPISGAVRGGIGEDGALLPISATLHIGAGVVQPNPNTRPIPFTGARTYFTYLPAERKLSFAEVSVDSAWGAADAEGDAYLDGLDEGRLDRLVAQFRLSGLRVNPANVFDDPLELERAEIDFQMRLDPFHVQVGRMNVIDDDRTLLVRSDLMADPEGWQLALDAQLDAITPAQVLGYWPEKVAPKPREWVVENLRKAQLSDLDLALRLRPGVPPDLYADFDFADAEIRFARTLPPLVNARGQASLLGRRFAVTADAGQIRPEAGGPIDASGTSFIIPDIGIRKSAPGIARITANGSVTAALSLLNRPPLSIMDKAGLPVNIAQGRAALAGTLALPLRDQVKLSDMEFHFSGAIDDVRSADLVPGTEVSAKRLEVTGNQAQVSIRGDGLFGSVPARVQWRQPLAEGAAARSELAGTIELSPVLLREQRLGLPEGMVTGSGQARFSLGIGGGQPMRLEADTNLAGVRLELPELGWIKPEATTGRLVLGATLGAGGSVDKLEIDAASLRATGTIDFRDDRSFDKARFSTFELGDWLAVPVELTGREGRVPDITVLGGRMDLRTATFGASVGGSGGGGGPALSVTLDRLQISDTLALTGMRGAFSTAGGLAGSFTGRLNGAAELEGQMIPRSGRSGMVLRSADAGAVFRAAGIITQAHGGSFQLSLDPVGEAGNYDGLLRVRSTRIKDAPAMAALLNAMSLVGLLDEMSGQGILFGEIDGRMRLGPTTLTVLEGSAVGPSIGLSMNGVVDTERRMLDLRGVISPIYLVNGIGSVLTRKGEGLFGFNYTLTGPLDKPQVFVNPLSGLAPGFLRDVIRAPAPQVPLAPGETPPPDAETEPRPPSDGGDR